jgi:hypothetical protein
MAGSICVGCGRGFVVAGPDPAPYCSTCEPAAQLAHAARARRSMGPLGRFFVFLFVIGLFGFVFVFFAARDVGPEVATTYEGPEGR